MGSTSPQLNFFNRCSAAQTRLTCFPIDLVFFLHGAILAKSIAVGANGGAPLFNSLSKYSNRFFADGFGFCSSQPWLDKGPHLHKYCPDQPLIFGPKGLT